MRVFLYVVLVFLTCDGIYGALPLGSEFGRLRTSASRGSLFPRFRRDAHRLIDPVTECFMVTTEEGEFAYRSPSDEPTVCGIYMITDPDKRIQVQFNFLDVPCDNEGLVAWVDGWELNGEVWPADDWDDKRLFEFCNKRPMKKLISRQNAALVQYRVPATDKGFILTIRHINNPAPCNLMLYGPHGVFTLTNHGLPGNCSLLAIAPAGVTVLNLDVGQTVWKESLLNVETGTINKCKKRGMDDYVDIGGMTGLDHTKMKVLRNICGLDSREDQRGYLIACDDTAVRMVSSGRFHNSVTLSFEPLTVDNIVHADLVCGLDES